MELLTSITWPINFLDGCLYQVTRGITWAGNKTFTWISRDKGDFYYIDDCWNKNSKLKLDNVQKILTQKFPLLTSPVNYWVLMKLFYNREVYSASTSPQRLLDNKFTQKILDACFTKEKKEDLKPTKLATIKQNIFETFKNSRHPFENSNITKRQHTFRRYSIIINEALPWIIRLPSFFIINNYIFSYLSSVFPNQESEKIFYILSFYLMISSYLYYVKQPIYIQKLIEQSKGNIRLFSQVLFLHKDCINKIITNIKEVIKEIPEKEVAKIKEQLEKLYIEEEKKRPMNSSTLVSSFKELISKKISPIKEWEKRKKRIDKLVKNASMNGSDLKEKIRSFEKKVKERKDTKNALYYKTLFRYIKTQIEYSLYYLDGRSYRIIEGKKEDSTLVNGKSLSELYQMLFRAKLKLFHEKDEKNKIKSFLEKCKEIISEAKKNQSGNITSELIKVDKRIDQLIANNKKMIEQTSSNKKLLNLDD